MVNRKSTRDLRHCAPTNHTAFEKQISLQGISVCRHAIYRMSA